MGLPFEQQPKESAKAFAAFAIYLNLGVERSLAAVGRRLGKSVALLERWSVRWRWGERAKAHAAHLAMVEREASEALVRGVSAEWLRRQQTLRETEWEMHEQCIAAAKRGLKAFMEREKVYANLADIARVLEVASKLGRLASGMATDKTELTGEDGGPIRVELSAALEKVYGAVVDVEAVAQIGGEGRQETGGRGQEGEGGDTSPPPSPQSGEGEESAGTSPRPSPRSGEGEARKGQIEGAASESTSPRPSPQGGEGEGGDTSRPSDSQRGKGECEGSAL